VRRQRADHEPFVGIEADASQLTDTFDVDEGLRLEQPLLHDDAEIGAAGIRPRLSFILS